MLGGTLLGLAMLGMLLWATLAIYFADTHGGPRTIRAALFAVASVAAVLFIRPRRYGLIGFLVLFVAVLAWFFSLQPSDERDWQPELEKAPWGEITGDRLTLHNVRNFDYRTETDFTPAWEDRIYDLSHLRSVDLLLAYWGSPALAHVMVSFGFDDGRHLAVSIETRKERSESYSTIQSFFRQYELIYIFADERDVVRLRTNHRQGEDVYLYQTNMTPKQARAGLESYLHAAQSLKDQPQFYNALTSNCASNVLEHARHGGLQAQYSMDVVLSGHAARQAYANGRLDSSLPFEELQSRSRINAAARAADGDPNFSERIRSGLPERASTAGTSAQLSPGTSGPTPH